MDRRGDARYPRRIEVRFWRRGEMQPHSGFTVNVSRTGLFLGTGQALTQGERVRLELVDADKGFTVEGRVARVHRVALALRHVEQAGVGIRFLLPEELVAELVPAARAMVGSRAGAGPGRGPKPAPEPQEPAGEASLAAPEEETVGLEVVAATFVDASSFLSVYHRDISSGGLFLSTGSPAELHQIVVVELRIPGVEARPPRFKARVVHRIAPEAAVGVGRNVLAGMGVQFLEPERVIEVLGPVLAQLRR